MNNCSDLLIKKLVKDVLIDSNCQYKRLYSNILKTDNSLRLKYFDVKTENLDTIVKELQKLKYGFVEIVKSSNDYLNTKKSIVVYVDKENIV